MATDQERDAFMRGWRAAMAEVIAVLSAEAQEWVEEEGAGAPKLPGSFVLGEVRGSFRGRYDLMQWIMENGPAAARSSDPALKPALEALVEEHATDQQRTLLGLAPLTQE